MEKLKSSSAFGHNGIDAITIKSAAAILAPPVTHIVNLSLGAGIFPANWKLGRVVPVLKSRDLDKTNLSAYRPISQLSLISKLAEKCVQVQLLNHLEETGQLSSNHHAYRTSLSTTTALLQATDRITEAIDCRINEY